MVVKGVYLGTDVAMISAGGYHWVSQYTKLFF